MLFSEVVGQSSLKEKLIQLSKNDKLPHALMFLGDDGLGGLVLALALAQYVNCDEPGDVDACGRCNSCVQMSKLVHPDVHFTLPTIPNSKGMNKSILYISEIRSFILEQPYGSIFDWFNYLNVENKQGNISALECRSIIEQLNLKSYQGKKKIQIMWRPEYLGKEGNMLLKLIEEPTDDTLLIFVAEDEELILSTIKSRVQQIRLKPLTPQEIASALKKNHNIDNTRALQIAHLSEGNFHTAQFFLTHLNNDLLPEVINFLNAVVTNRILEISKWVEDTAQLGRESQKHLLKYMEKIFGLAMNVSLAPDFPIHLPDADKEVIYKIAKRNIDPAIYEQFIQLFHTTNYHISRNTNNKIALLNMCIQSQYFFQGKTLVAH